MAERIRAVVERLGIEPELPAFPRRAYLDAIRVDKKRREAHIRFVVLRRIGAADTVPLTPSEVYPPRPGARQRRPRRGSQRT